MAFYKSRGLCEGCGKQAACVDCHNAKHPKQRPVDTKTGAVKP
jgi:hypothetical protein